MTFKHTLKEALKVALVAHAMVFFSASSTLVKDESKCSVNIHLKETRKVDLGYMYSEKELGLLMDREKSAQFLPGLKALLSPFISLLVTKEIEIEKISNSSLRRFKLGGGSDKRNFVAAYGSVKTGRVYSTDFKVHSDPVVTMTGSLIVSGFSLHFLEYNASVSSGDFIGYDLAILMDLEVYYLLAIEPKGTKAVVTLHQELAGSSSITFADHTNCAVVEKHHHLSLGRMCSPQILDEVSKWKGLGNAIAKFVKPVLYSAVYCSFSKIFHSIAEVTVSYAVMLTK